LQIRAFHTGLLLSATALWLLAGSALAQSSLDEETTRLRTIERQIGQAKTRSAVLDREREALAAEMASVSDRLVALAGNIQSREARISESEKKLLSLALKENTLRSRLRGRRSVLAELLAGLQKLERNPPPPLAVEPGDAIRAVRGALLFGAVVPDLKGQAASLTRELAELEAVRQRIETARTELDIHITSLGPARTELETLLVRKQALLAKTARELEAEQTRALQLAQKARDIRQLLTSLAEERRKAQVRAAEAEARRIAEHEARKAEARRLAEAKAEAQKKAEAERIARAAAEKARLVAEQKAAEAEARRLAELKATQEKEAEAERIARIAAEKARQLAEQRLREAEARRLAELKIAEQKAAEAETAARAAAEKAQRLAALEQKQKAEAAARQKRAKPPVKFASSIGKLAYPAQGELVRNFNDKDGYGGRSEGLHIATGKLAQITTPADGDVEFAGEFRSYGKLIIINTGDGYHVLLAGLHKITVSAGQTVAAGEPVGTMGEHTARGTLIGDRIDDPRPILYVEVRKGAEAIDSSRWWVDGGRKAVRRRNNGGNEG
jgi:septal ring factor EnvC (AmiA/AmiB activator)